MKEFKTKPLKNADKHEDGLLDLLIANKQLNKEKVTVKYQPAKSYKIIQK